MGTPAPRRVSFSGATFAACGGGWQVIAKSGPYQHSIQNPGPTPGFLLLHPGRLHCDVRLLHLFPFIKLACCLLAKTQVTDMIRVKQLPRQRNRCKPIVIDGAINGAVAVPPKFKYCAYSRIVFGVHLSFRTRLSILDVGSNSSVARHSHDDGIETVHCNAHLILIQMSA